MSARTIEPGEAIQVAVGAYKLQNSPDIEQAFQGLTLLKDFDFTNKTLSEPGAAQRFTARTGALEFKSKTGFAVMAMGKPDGRHAGEAILICRGTDTWYDWLTDANYAIVLGPSGSRVHSGFNQTFNDMKDGFLQFLTQNAPRKVHCVGHSLGGALVTLAADWLTNNGYAVELYTFGSPRVGTEDFASTLTQRVGPGRIHRVCHSSDPVSMVPVWPYMHAPRPDGECWINFSDGMSASAHRSATYVATLGKNNSWSELLCPTPSMVLEYSVRLWTTESLVSLLTTAPLLAFNAILRMLCKGLAVSLQPGVSLIDQTSMWVMQVVNSPIQEDAGPALMFLHALAKVLGIVMVNEQQVAHEQIKQLFRAFLWVRYRQALQASAYPN